MCARYPKEVREQVARRRVLAAVEDLLFKSKISETADVLGVEARFPRSKARLLEALRESPPDLLILDLNSMRFEPLELLQAVKSDDATKDVPTVGFLSHVQKDLAVAARESGCDRVMARSAFTKDLPRILERGEAGETVDKGGVG
jgi:PleD family two-component response regulator